MIRSFDALRHYTIRATDGAIGSVRDVWFDDADWIIRHLVADTGTWLPGREILIPTAIVDTTPLAQQALAVPLTRAQVKDSPEAGTGTAPVDRSGETALFGYYGVQPYWLAPGFAGGALTSGFSSGTSDFGRALQHGPGKGPHDYGLRSARAMIGHDVAGRDAAIGRVADVLFEDADWRVRYLAIDASAWLPQRMLVLAPDWMEAIDWERRTVRTGFDRDQLRNGPTLAEVAKLDRGFEQRLHAHYQRRPHWS